jgi:hypothetical protein
MSRINVCDCKIYLGGAFCGNNIPDIQEAFI